MFVPFHADLIPATFSSISDEAVFNSTKLQPGRCTYLQWENPIHLHRNLLYAVSNKITQTYGQMDQHAQQYFQAVSFIIQNVLYVLTYTESLRKAQT